MTKRVQPSGARRSHFIRDWRKHRKLTQEELAERLGTSNAQISRIETGKNGYTQDFLEACASALSCAPADLLRGPPDDRHELAQMLEGLTRLQAIQALKMVKIFADEDVVELEPIGTIKTNTQKAIIKSR